MIKLQKSRDSLLLDIRAQNIVTSMKDNHLITIILEPCSVCNLKCNYCNMHSSKTDVTSQIGVMDMSLYKKILMDISDLDYKLKALHFHGWGEPTMHKNLPEMIRLARDLNIADRYIVITNGTLLKEAMLKYTN